MRITFESRGTRGDVAPIIALGAEMVRRGHSCHILANCTFEADAQAAGLPFTAISNQVGLRPPKLENYIFSEIDSVARFFSGGRSDCSVLVNCDRYAASNLIAERDGLPVVRIHLSPFKLRSYEQAYAERYDLFAKNSRVLAHVNGLRAALRLGGVTTAAYEEEYVVKHIAAFPRWFCEPSAGWPKMEFTGFPLEKEAGSLSPAVLEFLSRGDKPVVFTFGTGHLEVDELAASAAGCCQALGLRGLFLSPYVSRGRAWSEHFLHADYAPLGLLLPQAALIVHHGGIGTAARALQAGIAQVICPMRFDQPHNGALVSALGVGVVLEGSRPSPQALAERIAQIIGNADIRECLADSRRRVAESEGVDRMADILEGHFGHSRRSTAQ